MAEQAETKEVKEPEEAAEVCYHHDPHANIATCLNAINACDEIDFQLLEGGKNMKKRILQHAFNIIDYNMMYLNDRCEEERIEFYGEDD